MYGSMGNGRQRLCLLRDKPWQRERRLVCWVACRMPQPCILVHRLARVQCFWATRAPCNMMDKEFAALCIAVLAMGLCTVVHSAKVYRCMSPPENAGRV